MIRKCRGHSKIDETKIFMTNGSLIKVESIAECSPWNFYKTFSLNFISYVQYINTYKATH